MLKIDKDDPEQGQKELEFDVKCTLLLPPEERLERWLEWNLQMLHFAKKQRKELGYGHEDTTPVTKRS